MVPVPVLPEKVFAGYFLLYGFAGCVHIWIAFHYFPNHGDVWNLFYDSVGMKQYLLHDFDAFQKDFLLDSFSGITRASGLFQVVIIFNTNC